MALPGRSYCITTQHAENKVSLEIREGSQTCSLTVNFTTRRCEDERNLFAPFSAGGNTLFDAVPMNQDSFLWKVPNFGLLKVQPDGSVFFGHQADDVPLAQDELVFATSGKLYLESLKVIGLKLKSKQTQLCEAVVVDNLEVDHTVVNSGSVKVRNISGPGELINQGLLEFEGTVQQSGQIAVRRFSNRKGSSTIHPTVRASHLKITGNNETLTNFEDAAFDISDSLLIDRLPSLNEAIFTNRGSFKVHTLNSYRETENTGFMQADQLVMLGQTLRNREFGQIKLLNGLTVYSSIINDGEIQAQRFVNIGHGTNNGTITGSPELSLSVTTELINSGRINLRTLIGPGTFKNHGVLSFVSPMPSYIKMVINASLNGKVAKIEGKGLYLQGGTLCNEIGSEIHLEGELSLASINPLGGDNVVRLSYNKGTLKVRSLNCLGEHGLANSGSIETGPLQLTSKTFLNNLAGGTLTITGSSVLVSANLTNGGTLVSKQSNLVCTNTPLTNTGNWLFENVTSTDTLTMNNSGTLQFKDCTLTFAQLVNSNDLILQSGSYIIDSLTNRRLQLLDQNWVITDDIRTQAPHKVILTNSHGIGIIECQCNLIYDIATMPNSLKCSGDVNYSNRHVRDLHSVSMLKVTGKVTAWCRPINLILKEKKDSGCFSFSFGDYDFTSIVGHLELYVQGAFTSHFSFKAPILTLHVNGPLILGKDNTQLGTIAATSGALTISAASIDGQFGKFYGKGPTSISANQGDIVIGAPTRGIDETIKQQYTNGLEAVKYTMYNVPAHLLDHSLNQANNAYIATDSHLTLQSKANIFVKYGSVMSSLGNRLVAKNIENCSGIISSQGPITMESDTYNHTREGAVNKHHPWWTPALQYPGSGPATLESLKRIDFSVKKICNRAGSIRSGENITINGVPTLNQAAGYFEEPQHFYCHWFANGYGTNWGPRATLLLTQSCTTQAAGTIQMNLGNFVVTGSMNAGTILINANTGLFGNTSRSRETVNATQPIVVNVTQYLQDQARNPGMYRLTNGRVETEFPMGAPSRPQLGDQVLLQQAGRAEPVSWASIFNPLNTINLDLHLQQLLSNLAGKVYAGSALGTQLSTILWANANQWRQQHNIDVMSPVEMQRVNRTMLLSQISREGMTEQQHTLLCIAPDDINAYQSPGDISGDSVNITTVQNQTHLNNRVVATGPDGITLKSTTGSVHLETQSHVVEYDVGDSHVVQQRANPQQQLIAKAGPVHVTAQKDITRTGTLIAASGDVTEHAETGSLVKNPLILQTTVTTHSQDDGFFSSSETSQTSLTHQVLPSTTVSGATLHQKAGTSIRSVAPQDAATSKIVYEAPITTIEGIILADRTVTSSEKSGLFSEQSSSTSKESPCSTPANIQAPVVQLIGKDARINANVQAKELSDETENGAQFVAKVAQMLCSSQSLSSSPFINVDAGFSAGYEVMIPPMLMVEKIIRTRETGQMLFESAVLDKSRTEIIGKYVETTYQLKRWQVSWCRVDQLIPNEALVVIAIGIVLVTQGMGAELLGPLLKGVGMQLTTTGAAMVNAGFTTICSSTSTSFLRTGDPIAAITQLASGDQLKALVFNMASAGLCAQLGDMLKINMKPEAKSLINHVKEQTLRTTVDTLLNVALNDVPLDKALGIGSVQIPLRALAAYASNQISGLYLDKIARGAAQAIIGGIAGLAVDPSTSHGAGLRGFVSGAVGALTAETLGNFLLDDAKEISRCATERLRSTGKKHPVTVQQAIEKEVRYRSNLVKILTASVATVAKQNVPAAMAGANNVVDNDLALRSSLYAMSEYKRMLLAASQAVITLGIPDEVLEQQLKDGLFSSEVSVDDSPTSLGEEKKPFVTNPKAGLWTRACISGDLILTDEEGKSFYLDLKAHWTKDAKCPFNVFAHGMPSGVQVDTDNHGPVLIDERELARLIRASPGYKEGQHINLFSCNTGIDPQGIAQRLANEMNVSVSAPTGVLSIFDLLSAAEQVFPLHDRPDGAFVVYDTVFTAHAADNDLDFREIKTFTPQGPNATPHISNLQQFWGH